MIFLWIIVAIVMFSIIVLVHEYGHFKSARIFWVRIEEFGLWLPPRAKKLWTDTEWTLYSLNWLPLGWFVKITWESPNTFYVFNKKWKLYNNEKLEKTLKKWKKVYDKKWLEVNKKSRKIILKKLEENRADYNLMNKPYWQQAIIILGWVVMNFLLAIVIFTILFMVWVKPIWVNDKIATNLNLKLIPTIEQSIESWLLTEWKWILLYPIEWSIAAMWWIQEWDVLLKINSENISSIEDVQRTIWESSSKSMNLYIERKIKAGCDVNKDCSSVEYIALGLTPSEEGKIGSYLSENISIDQDFEYKYNFPNALKHGTLETYGHTMLTFKAIWILVRKIFNPETPIERQEAIQQISWPIGVVDFVAQALSGGMVLIFIISAIISINLWVFNLLPIPALDGGRFLFILINWAIVKIFWKKAMSANIEWIIHWLFFILLIALSLIIAYNDVIKIINN